MLASTVPTITEVLLAMLAAVLLPTAAATVMAQILEVSLAVTLKSPPDLSIGDAL